MPGSTHGYASCSLASAARSTRTARERSEIRALPRPRTRDAWSAPRGTRNVSSGQLEGGVWRLEAAVPRGRQLGWEVSRCLDAREADWTQGSEMPDGLKLVRENLCRPCGTLYA